MSAGKGMTNGLVRTEIFLVHPSSSKEARELYERYDAMVLNQNEDDDSDGCCWMAS
ncbi:uncharacterized protein PHALS_01853 [Plasmopara halstedii]|uniref:Uncharacterized protein n=1 Tax=Plasmopara halstedii TaxID=4781 RepID=A0A0P1ATB4_PLAHL|nr:uncharacterized protein PHALS_01853 [Plasmopara halstedii]CEG45566.1 hypothetical protein PHALS_01853 [Plasmopara halstedii]|eukprot:XP_024581935.1 hypothetical protein PHALS_01853 [Plasmopara halstedii]